MGDKKKLIIGLTGPTGSGKSTLARQFERLGCAVISADKLNHEVLGLPKVIRQIESWWGSHMLDSAGRIDREAVGRLVFEDEAELKKLTNLVHPLIEARERSLIEHYNCQPGTKAIVLDVPLLFETGQNKWCEAVILVLADEGVRQARLSEKRNWGPEKLKKVENFQLALDMKVKMSDYIVRNNSTITDLNNQVAELLSQIITNNKVS